VTRTTRTRSRVHTAPHHRHHSRLTPLPLRFTAARQTRAPLVAPTSALRQPRPLSDTHSLGMAQQLADCGPIAMSPFTRLATVELQLVMHFCDQSTLIALARCSRTAFAAAKQPFAWRCLSPLSLSCSSPLELSARMADSLLRHAQLSVEWTIPAPAAGSAAAQANADAKKADAAATAAEIAALVSLPRLRHLSVRYHRQSPDSHLTHLVTALREHIEHGGALVRFTLQLQEFRESRISESVFVSLGALLERSRTLAALKVFYNKMDAAMVRALAAGLQKNESLATLNLSRCSLGDDGAIARRRTGAQPHSDRAAAGTLLDR